MTSDQRGSYALGDTRATMPQTKGLPSRKAELIPFKMWHSSDCALQLERMKPESLVTVGQPYHGEYVLEPCTHRPSSQPSRQHLKRPPSADPTVGSVRRAKS
jgi:hypothetical protein